MNVICGRNNAGKSALLEALSLSYANEPHLSEHTAPHASHPLNPESVATVTAFFDAADVKTMIAQTFGAVCLQVGRGTSEDAYPSVLSETLTRSHTLKSQWSPQRKWTASEAFDGLHAPSSITLIYETSMNSTDVTFVRTHPNHGLSPTNIETKLYDQLTAGIYRFAAERFHVGSHDFGDSTWLHPNARNLPVVLNVLQSNPERFRKFNDLVRRVLPHVARVTVRPVGQKLEIRVWRGLPTSEAEHLSIPLDKCGTGVGQVLAMLYAVTNTDAFGHVILIDEPNSFLHPGAVRALFEVFEEFSQHQYIITTHSPTVISAASERRVFMMTADGAEAIVSTIDARQLDEQRFLLNAVGASLGDVLGPNSILWVEGPSEASAFPLIAEAFDISLAKTAILPLVQTGDFDGKLAGTADRIYAGLARGIGLIPSACGFLLDREKRDEETCRRMKERAIGRFEFLPRRMFENYLLCPAAVASWMNRFESTSRPIDAVGVSSRIAKISNEMSVVDVPFSSDWFIKVDGARILQKLVAEWTGNVETYDKVRDARALTEDTISVDKGSLAEIASTVRALVAPLVSSVQ